MGPYPRRYKDAIYPVGYKLNLCPPGDRNRQPVTGVVASTCCGLALLPEDARKSGTEFPPPRLRSTTTVETATWFSSARYTRWPETLGGWRSGSRLSPAGWAPHTVHTHHRQFAIAGQEDFFDHSELLFRPPAPSATNHSRTSECTQVPKLLSVICLTPT